MNGMGMQPSMVGMNGMNGMGMQPGMMGMQQPNMGMGMGM